MNIYYCHECSVLLGILPGKIDDFNPTGSIKQLEKYYKHTVPSNDRGINSIFDLTDNKKYKDYLINTLVSGSVEIDEKDNTNVVWIAGRKTGFTLKNGKFYCKDDSVKVVYHDDKIRIHGFPTGSAKISEGFCLMCGGKIGY